MSVVGRSRELSDLVGRDDERSCLADQIDAARAGRGSATLVCGEPGIGKTSLVEAAAALADDFSVLRCRGIEIEMALPFSGLHELLLPLAATIDELPAAQRDPLHEAFRAASGTTPPVLSVALGALTAIAQDAARRPVLLIADDVQWLDEATVLVLSFVARRIAHDPVALLMTSRTTDAHRLIPSTRVDLTPLTADETQELAQREGNRRLHETTAAAVVHATGGNPLAVIETMRLLGDDIDRVGTILDAPLPASELIERGLGARIDHLPREAFEVVVLASVTLTDSVAGVLDAAEQLGHSTHALELAEDAGIVRRDVTSFAFAHPLLRSVAFHRAEPTLRRRCHAALADVAPDRASRAWHAASAAMRADDTIADELATIADDLAARGGHLAATRAMERAARLTADDHARAERLVSAGMSARLATRNEWSRRLIAEAHALATTGSAVQLFAERELIILDAHTGSNEGLIERMLDLADAAERVDGDLRLDVLSMAASEAGLQRRVALASDVLTRILTSPPPSDPEIKLAVAMTNATTMLISRGDLKHGEPLLIASSKSAVSSPAYWNCASAMHLVDLDHTSLAQQVLDALFAQLRQSDDLHTLAAALWMQAYVRLHVGDWATAEVEIEQSRQVTETGGLQWQHTMTLALLALARARRGHASAPALADEARSLAAEHDQLNVEELVYAAIGLYELGRERGPEAVAALERIATWAIEVGLEYPNYLTWRSDYVDALLLVGEETRARDYLDWLRVRVERSGAPWARAAVARLDGMLAPADAFATHFDRALAIHAELEYPFEAARAHLGYGRRLRRAGRRADAQVQLMLARSHFERLGAATWLEQTNRELLAAGAATDSAHSSADARPALTPQERVVADCVAQGMTNKEAAAHLFLTVKTIEWHLRQIYRKLGIRSRVQLATYVNRG